CSIRMNPAGFWWAATPEDEWPDDEDSIAEIRSMFVGEHGDRHQELVFNGNAMSQARITEILDECLLTNLELAQGLDGWADMEEPSIIPSLHARISRLQR
ncbi:GTP-binding protein, partial [Rhodopirellula bahusiensis]